MRVGYHVVVNYEAGGETAGMDVPVDVDLQEKIVLDRKEGGDLIDLTKNLASAIESEEEPASAGQNW
jgi:hypothetical protein